MRSYYFMLGSSLGAEAPINDLDGDGGGSAYKI